MEAMTPDDALLALEEGNARHAAGKSELRQVVDAVLPAVESSVETGSVSVVAAVYEIETGRVELFQ